MSRAAVPCATEVDHHSGDERCPCGLAGYDPISGLCKCDPVLYRVTLMTPAWFDHDTLEAPARVVASKRVAEVVEEFLPDARYVIVQRLEVEPSRVSLSAVADI